MDGEVDGTQAQGQEQQGQQVDQEGGDDQQKQQEAQQVGAALTDEKIRAALAERDQKIAELEAQVAEASKTVDSAEALARQIEELKASADEERVGFELRLAGARSVTAARALLAEHGGDVAALKGAEPWLFSDPAPQGGSTGLEPAGATKAVMSLGHDREMRGRSLKASTPQWFTAAVTRPRNGIGQGYSTCPSSASEALHAAWLQSFSILSCFSRMNLLW